MLREFLLKKDVSVDPPIYKNAGVNYTVWGAMCVEFLEQAHTSYESKNKIYNFMRWSMPQDKNILPSTYNLLTKRIDFFKPKAQKYALNVAVC